jgi:leucyl-tRNA synthetase
MPAKNFYITTPIYYVNDVPHIGHAYTTIAADVMARYKRMRGFDVMFATGTDEHGQKIQQAAEKRDMTAQQLVDSVMVNFKNLWKELEITNTDFIRTTEARHERVVQYIFSRLMEQGTSTRILQGVVLRPLREPTSREPDRRREALPRLRQGAPAEHDRGELLLPHVEIRKAAA